MDFDDDKRKLLAHQQNAQADISTLISDLQIRECSVDEAVTRLLATQNDVKGLDESLRNLLEPIYYNERRSEGSTAAQKVFDVPELLELILLHHVTISDVMSVYQVSRGLRDIIDGSSKLQSRLFLKTTSETSDKRAVLSIRLPSFTCVKMYSLRGDDGIRVSARVWMSRGKCLPAIGPRWRRMLLSQPPMQEAEVSLSSATAGFDTTSTDRVYVERCERGITIGHVLNAAERMIEQRTQCEDPSESDDDSSEPEEDPSESEEECRVDARAVHFLGEVP